MISVVVWKWAGYRTFGPETVNVMASMVRRHYGPHRFICVTNDAVGLDSSVEVVPDREDFATVVSPHGSLNPSCYRRLRLYAPDTAETFGEHVVSLDLDVVITNDLRPLWDRPEDFVAWRDPLWPMQYNGSMTLLRTGTRPKVWSQFDPATSPRESLVAGFMGSDQGWISYCLPGEATWSRQDGVYSYRADYLNRKSLPENARVIIFHGRQKPWDAEAQQLAWVREHYR